MRTSERFRKLRKWLSDNLCEGRMMKTPGKDIADIAYQKPRCYLAWWPTRYDASGNPIVDASGSPVSDPIAVCPSILIMPKPSNSKYMEEKRFDKYNNVHRPQEMGQNLAVDILFSVYEPGVRLPGFVESAENGNLDMSLFQEGTEEGLFTLMDWMDDFQQLLLGSKIVPGTDLFAIESTMAYSLYTDQSFVVDKRPIYYGFVTVTFGCYAEEGTNRSIDQFLE